MTDEERHDVDYVKSMLETAADLLERLAHELVATNKRLVQLEACVEPLAKHPIGFDDKPMMDWYYDDDGVCRPSRAGPTGAEND